MRLRTKASMIAVFAPRRAGKADPSGMTTLAALLIAFFAPGPAGKADPFGMTALAAGRLAGSVGQAMDRDGTVNLFNGRDLAGWSGDPRFWSVRDGAITGATTPENPARGNTFLIWTGGVVKDFELRIKFRIQGGNSGIQYRSKDNGNWVVGGYQADIDSTDTYTGILYEERGRGILAKVGEKVTVGADGKPIVTGSVGVAGAIKAAIKKGDWNQYVLVARGNQLVHSINGRVTVQVVDEDVKGRAMEGILALQLHAGPPMTVQFKDIRLKPLGDSEQPVPASSLSNWDP